MGTSINGSWRGQRERGNRTAFRLMIWLALHCGRSLCRVLLLPVCGYFFLTAGLARRSSRAFMSRALERRATWSDTLRHFFVFATTLLDRIYLVNGRERELAIDMSNEPAFVQALAQGRGCLLLGSHLGSFELLGIVGGREKKLAVSMVMHLDDNAGLRDMLSRSERDLPYKVIALGSPESMLRVKECLDRGEVVGILADRVYAGEPTQSLPFLGRPARFSLSPLRLARITGAPVLMVFGLFRGARRYEIVFERLAGAADLRSYVEILERQVRRSPYNWFNFYDYWSA